MHTITPEKLEALAAMDFDSDAIATEPTPEPEQTPEPTEAEQTQLTEALQPLEPIEFDDDDAPIEFEVGMGDRPFHKRPGPLLVAGAAIIGLCCIGLAALIGAGGNDLSKVMAKNEAPTGQVAPTETATPDDPKDKTIGDLRSQEASRRLAAEIKKQEEERKRQANKGRNSDPNRVPPTVAAPTTIAASSVPDTDYSSPAPYRSQSSYSAPAPYQSSYTPRYQPSSSYSSSGGRSPATPQAPAKPPKMLAFGAMPENKATPRQAQQPAAPQNASYQTVSYNNQTQSQPIGFGSDGDALRSQQAAFISGTQAQRIQIGTTARGTISSGAIMPNRFLVQLDQPLGSMPIGTQIIFEPRTVYPNGKLEAYAIGIARGEYQRIVPVPMGAIAVFSTSGKILKARKPSAGFFNSVPGQMLVGGLSGAASRFLATDSTTTITDAGTQTNSRAGGKGIGDVALSFAQGSVSPLMQQLRPTQMDGGKAEFSLEPGQALLVKVLQPFTF